MWRHLDVSEIDSVLYDSYKVGNELRNILFLSFNIVSYEPPADNLHDQLEINSTSVQLCPADVFHLNRNGSSLTWLWEMTVSDRLIRGLFTVKKTKAEAGTEDGAH